MVKKVHPVAQVIFFPLSAYLFIGTNFLFILFKFEKLIKKIESELKSDYFRHRFKPREHHKTSFWYTIFFFILFVFILIHDIAMFIAIGSMYLYEYIIEVVEILYEKIIEQVQLLWESISNIFK